MIFKKFFINIKIKQSLFENLKNNDFTSSNSNYKEEFELNSAKAVKINKEEISENERETINITKEQIQNNIYINESKNKNLNNLDTNNGKLL